VVQTTAQPIPAADAALPVRVAFFDLRDTLGEVDRPGHLVPYRPSTEKLLAALREVVGLRIGVITNLPAGVSAAQGRHMITDAVLAEEDHRLVRLGDLVDPDGIVINHEVGVDKPDPRIYQLAARQMGVDPRECLFSGENLVEVLAAQAAGMHAQLKPTPPGREFQPAVISRLGHTEKDSGRAFEAFLEHEHLLGERIFACGSRIVAALRALSAGEPIPANVRTAMAMLVYLVNNFADQVHLQAEEAIIPLAVARGMPVGHGRWVFDQHDQARAYWRALSVAWKRIEADDADDAWYAIGDFWRTTEAFVILFQRHAVREDDELYPAMGSYFNDTDDTLVMNMIAHVGPPDITPYVALVQAMEQALGIEVAT